ncbi:MAG: hypothetical protein ACYCWW_05685 [Deltaproteobacteria bacterium]
MRAPLLLALASLSVGVAALADPAPASPAPGSNAGSGQPPSSQLLELRLHGAFGFGTVDILAAGKVLDSSYAGGLDTIVQGSVRAQELARPAHSRLVTGAIFSGAGLALGLGAAITPAIYGLLNPSPTVADVRLLVLSSLGGGIASAILTLVGSHFRILGIESELAAVDAYNEDLVDAKLRRSGQ